MNKNWLCFTVLAHIDAWNVEVSHVVLLWAGRRIGAIRTREGIHWRRRKEHYAPDGVANCE